LVIRQISIINVMTNNDKRISLRSRRAISPILAVVVLLGITVVAGGLVFTLFTSSATTASTVDSIMLQNAQAVKGSSHADFTVNVKNAGSVPWTEISLTITKSELSEPIIYESLHEVVMGCTETTNTLCDDDDTNVAGSRDNPMRAQWLVSLDKKSGTGTDADFGEGIAAGRKMVFQDKDDNRTLSVMNGTAVAALMGQSGSSFGISSQFDGTPLTISSSDQNFIAEFKFLDSKVKGNAIFCKEPNSAKSAAGVFAECKIFTHKKITTIPAGQSVFFYADLFTTAVTGLDNQVSAVGDNLVINIATKNSDGGTGRLQTIVKVTGV